MLRIWQVMQRSISRAYEHHICIQALITQSLAVARSCADQPESVVTLNQQCVADCLELAGDQRARQLAAAARSQGCRRSANVP